MKVDIAAKKMGYPSVLKEVDFLFQAKNVKESQKEVGKNIGFVPKNQTPSFKEQLAKSFFFKQEAISPGKTPSLDGEGKTLSKASRSHSPSFILQNKLIKNQRIEIPINKSIQLNVRYCHHFISKRAKQSNNQTTPIYERFRASHTNSSQKQLKAKIITLLHANLYPNSSRKR